MYSIHRSVLELVSLLSPRDGGYTLAKDYLARSANLPTGLYIFLVLILFNLRQIISESTRPIFTIFSPNGRKVATTTGFEQIGEMTFIQHAGVSKWNRTSEFTGIKNGNIFATCLLYTSPSPRDRQKSRMPSSA